MADRDLSKITPGERLLLDRLRRGESQEQAAARLGVGQRAYGEAETDRASLGNGAVPKRLRPTLGEQCRLARRRYGLDLRTTAAVIRCSHVSLLYGERIGVDWLVNAWVKLGYKFIRSKKQ